MVNSVSESGSGNSSVSFWPRIKEQICDTKLHASDGAWVD